MEEVDVEPVDGGDELRQGVELGLGPAPVIIRGPVPDERLQLRQLGALGLIGDGLFVGLARRSQAPADIVQLLLRDLHLERTDVGVRRGHGLPCRLIHRHHLS